MKYTVETMINLPRKRVVELFDNIDNIQYWQDGFISFETISGEEGQKGAKALLKYQFGKREIELTETITVQNLPDEFSGIYEMKGMWNEVKNYFIEVDENTTKWVSENEFRLSGFMKIVGFFNSKGFKKQTNKMHRKFKEFAESQK